MRIKDSGRKYGTITILFHWVTAIVMIGMFILGYWMRTLDYYSPYYQSAPRIHESIGLLMFVFVPLFLFWRLGNRNPDDSHLKDYERLTAGIVKKLLYLLMLMLLVSGYLLSTIGDTPVQLFNWFTIPAFITIDESKLLVGKIHEYFAYILMLFAAIHGAAALKHHFIDKDDTLARMLPNLNPKDIQETTKKEDK